MKEKLTNILIETGRGDANTKGRGDANTKGRGDSSNKGRGDANNKGSKDSKNGGTGGKIDITTDNPKNKKEGDSFRAWMKETNSNFKCPDGTPLLKSGPYDNDCIKKAWGQFKQGYADFINSGKKVVVTKTGEFPINTIELSNAFREWITDNFKGYTNTHPNFKTSITSTSEIADEPLKNAWFDKGDMYIDVLRNSSNSTLSSIGQKLRNDYDAWQKSDDAKSSLLQLQRKELEIQKKKCEPWDTDNIFDRRLPSEGYSEKNLLAREFIEWADKNGYFVNLPAQFCGESNTDTLWANSDEFKDNNGDTYQLYQHPIVRYMALIRKQIYNELKGIKESGNLLTHFLKLNGEDKNITSLDKNNVNKDVSKTVTKTNVAVTSPGLLSAARNAQREINRQNCKTLSSEINKVGGSTTDNVINILITRCKRDYSGTFNESIKNKITGKLKVMKENKSLNESVINKIKSKKNEKALSTLSEQFNKQNYRKFFDTLTKFRNNNINEATSTEFEKSFDVIFQGKEREFKNRAIEYILGKLEVSPISEMGVSIKSELDKIPAKDMFKNEYDVPEAVSRAIELSSQSTNNEENGLKGIVSKSIKFDNKQIKQGVRQHLHNYIESVKDSIKSLEQKLKSSIVKEL
jgi:hypothetical protein